jgi:hypothetical protein
VEDDRALLDVRSLEPEGNRERIVTVEVADFGFYGVVAGETKGLAGTGAAGDGFVFGGRSGGIVGSERVGEVGEAGRFSIGGNGRDGLGWSGSGGGFGRERRSVAAFEVEAGDFVGDRGRGRRKSREPSREGVAASFAKGRESGRGGFDRRGGAGEFFALG